MPEQTSKAHGAPTKDFFVRTITRDIALVDCILDLLDNSIDGARRTTKARVESGASPSLSEYRATIRLGNDAFEIADNCGGISLKDAVDYAFHFGRREDAPADVDGVIGLYGIGMKRAIFKMGVAACVVSTPRDDTGAFAVHVDVDEWKARENDWDFNIEPVPTETDPGTRVIISKLHPQVSAVFSDPTFANELVRTIARDYAFVLKAGFRVAVNDIEVPDYSYSLKQSAEITPAVVEHDDGGVKVRIVADLIQELSDDVPDESASSGYGALLVDIILNERVIVAGDKTDSTARGQSRLPSVAQPGQRVCRFPVHVQ